MPCGVSELRRSSTWRRSPVGLRSRSGRRLERSTTRGSAMKRFVFGVLVIGSVIAVIALIVRRRSGSGLDDEWDTFAEDNYPQVPASATKVSDTAKDAASNASGV